MNAEPKILLEGGFLAKILVHIEKKYTSDNTELNCTGLVLREIVDNASKFDHSSDQERVFFDMLNRVADRLKSLAVNFRLDGVK